MHKTMVHETTRNDTKPTPGWLRIDMEKLVLKEDSLATDGSRT